MEHINLFWSRLNIPTLLQACKDNLHWKETVFLYTHYDQFDNAIDIVIQHHPSCWDHEQFKSHIVRVSNTEVYYRAIDFYLSNHPLQLTELLNELATKLDHKRVVSMVRQRNQLPLIQRYLKHVQNNDIAMINEALNELYVEEEDYTSLRDSIDTYGTFDQISLATKMQTHELLEFRRISAYLYKMSKRWKRSIELSKKDSLWQDAMETAAESGDSELAEEIVRFFVNNKETPTSCFAACLYTCFPLLKPDVVLELAWRHDLQTTCMPFMIQAFRNFSNKVDSLQAKITQMEEDALAAREQEQKDQEAAVANQANDIYSNQLMLTSASNPPGVQSYMPQGYGVMQQPINPTTTMPGFPSY